MNSGNVRNFTGNYVHFGFGLAPEVNAHLQRAAAVVTNRDSSLEALIEALKLAPDQLEVLVALYKFHFYQGETEKAQDLVFQTLIKSSLLGGFSHDWKRLSSKSTDWVDPRGPGRVFLYSLKALAFIRLRQNDLTDAESILGVLNRLDPTDQVGADVVRDLLQGMLEGDDDD
ncbi:MAG: hypothetical protein ABW161_06585 [Candidatus Thiodiazotropha sp.]